MMTQTRQAVLLPLLALFCHASLQGAEAVPPDLPLPVASFGATAREDGSVFVYGGHSGTRHKYNRDEVHGTLYRWQPGAAAWEKLADDEPAQGASLLAVPGGVLRIGGMAARNAKGEKHDLWSSETAAIYDTQSGRWTPLPKLPQRRSSHDSTLVGSTVYVVGGWAMLGASDVKWHDTYLTLDLNQPEAGWKEHPQPFKRRALAVQAVDGKVYALGGMDSDDDLLRTVSVLDTTTGKWTEAGMLPKDDLGGFGFAALAHEGRLFASGAAGVLLEWKDGNWAEVAKLAHPRYFHRLVSAGSGRVLALGGESKAGRKTPCEFISTSSAGAAPKDKLAVPAAQAAKSSSTERDWPRYQGPRGNSTTPDLAWKKDWPADGPPVLWKAELGQGLSSCAIVGGRVYGAGNDGQNLDMLWCLDLETGKVIWRYDYASPTKCHEMAIVPYGPAATPTVADGKLWFISRDGQVLCLKADTGELVWKKHLITDLGGKYPVYGYSSSPFVHGGRIYLDNGGEGRSNSCLNALTGAVVWQAGDGEAGYATPELIERDGREVLVLFKGQGLELRAAADGALIARHATETRDFCNCATPVVQGDQIFISHTGNMGARSLRWDAGGLAEVWSERNLGLLFHSGLPWQGKLLAFNDQVRGANDLRLLDLATGRMLWKDTSVEKGTGLVTDDGHALLLTSRGELVLAKITDEKLDVLSRAQVLGGKCWVQPTLAGGRLVCKNNAGSVVCLDLK